MFRRKSGFGAFEWFRLPSDAHEFRRNAFLSTFSSRSALNPSAALRLRTTRQQLAPAQLPDGGNLAYFANELLEFFGEDRLRSIR